MRERYQRHGHPGEALLLEHVVWHDIKRWLWEAAKADDAVTIGSAIWAMSAEEIAQRFAEALARRD